MFEEEATEYATQDVYFDGVPKPVINHQRKEDWKKGAEFGYNKANEWHFIKDKLPPEPVVVGNRMFPKNYICAYSLNNEYGDYEIGDFLYYGNGVFNGENKDYPIYAWLEKPTVIPAPPKESE